LNFKIEEFQIIAQCVNELLTSGLNYSDLLQYGVDPNVIIACLQNFPSVKDSNISPPQSFTAPVSQMNYISDDVFSQNVVEKDSNTEFLHMNNINLIKMATKLNGLLPNGNGNISTTISINEKTNMESIKKLPLENTQHTAIGQTNISNMEAPISISKIRTKMNVFLPHRPVGRVIVDFSDSEEECDNHIYKFPKSSMRSKLEAKEREIQRLTALLKARISTNETDSTDRLSAIEISSNNHIKNEHQQQQQQEQEDNQQKIDENVTQQSSTSDFPTNVRGFKKIKRKIAAYIYI